jgi:hypothetical protein
MIPEEGERESRFVCRLFNDAFRIETIERRDREEEVEEGAVREVTLFGRGRKQKK